MMLFARFVLVGAWGCFMLLAAGAHAGPPATNVTLGKPVVASEFYGTNVGSFAVDGDPATRWENRARNRIAQLEIDLEGTFEIDRAELVTGVGTGHAPQFIQLLYHDGFCWQPIPGATSSDHPAEDRAVVFEFTESVIATKLRYHSLDDSNNLLEELSVFGSPAAARTATIGGCHAGEHRAVRGPWYDAAHHLPPDYNDDQSRRWPLIFSMHGIGGDILGSDHLSVLASPEGFAKQVANVTLADFDAIVVSAHCRAVGQTSTCWFQEDRVLAMLDELTGDYLVDPDRVFATGLSGGGIVSYRLGIDHPERFAGVAPVASSAPNGTDQPRCNLKKTHVWAFGGTADSLFPAVLNQNVLTYLRDECAPVGVSFMVATDIEGGTHSGSTWDVAYSTPALHQWFLDTTRRDHEIFANGFESGTTSGWSDGTP